MWAAVRLDFCFFNNEIIEYNHSEIKRKSNNSFIKYLNTFSFVQINILKGFDNVL